MSKPKTLRPGPGTIAAMRHVCPRCGAAQGVRCASPTVAALQYAHSKRMDLARTTP